MKTWQLGLTTALGVLAVALVSAQIGLATSNRTLQGQVNQRQQYLQQSAQLEGLYREMVRALAERAASSGDEALRDLLARNGVSYSVHAPAATPALPAAEPAAARKPSR